MWIEKGVSLSCATWDSIATSVWLNLESPWIKVHYIQTGTVSIRPNQRLGKGKGVIRLINTLTDRRWTEPLPIYAWVIEHPEGVILIDTGETARATEPGYFPSWHPYFKNVSIEVKPEQEVGPQLQKIGIHPKDVRWVIMTHLHTDHAGGLHHFPHSEIIIMERAFRLATGFMGKMLGFRDIPLKLCKGGMVWEGEEGGRRGTKKR